MFIYLEIGTSPFRVYVLSKIILPKGIIEKNVFVPYCVKVNYWRAGRKRTIRMIISYIKLKIRQCLMNYLRGIPPPVQTVTQKFAICNRFSVL